MRKGEGGDRECQGKPGQTTIPRTDCVGGESKHREMGGGTLQRLGEGRRPRCVSQTERTGRVPIRNNSGSGMDVFGGLGRWSESSIRRR